MSDTLPVVSYAIATHLDGHNHINTVQAASLEDHRLLIKDFIGTITMGTPEGIVANSSYELEVAEKNLEDIANHLRHFLNRKSEKYNINLYIDRFDIGAQSFFYELAKGNCKWIKPGGPCILTRVNLTPAGSNSIVNAVRVLEKVREISKYPVDDFTVIEHYPSHL